MQKNQPEVKKWVAISGTWKLTSEKVERDVRSLVRKVLETGGGVVTGGALNVDYFATDEAMRLDPKCERVKIFLPTTLEIYAKHYRKRAKEGVITKKQAEDLITQLEKLKSVNPKALIIKQVNKIVDKTAYFERNDAVVNASDELVIFHVIQSTGGGTSDAAEKAKKLGIPIKRYNYSIE